MQQDSIPLPPSTPPYHPQANAPCWANSLKCRCNGCGTVKMESSTSLTGFSLNERIPEQTRQKGGNTQEKLNLGGKKTQPNQKKPQPNQTKNKKKAVGQSVVSKE